MRGKGSCFYRVFQLPGITPAYAGKSLGSILIRSHIQDHPRLCGEKLRGVQSCRRASGSPPPMRGKANSRSLIFCALGITPAYAGKSTCCVLSRLGMGDHPRLCGEKGADGDICQGGQGSPPPMRGKVQMHCLVLCTDRITPAYAGKRFN